MKSAAYATPFTTDIAITGEISFATGYALVTGNATQSGGFSVAQGGVATTSTFADTTVSGLNPLLGTLTDFGDGFGNNVSATASAQDSHFGIGNDITLNISNSSLTDTYKITFKIDFSNSVDSGGADAFVHSVYDIRNPSNTEVFFTELITDTVNGNTKNGVSDVTLGGLVEDIGISFFDVVIDPGQSLTYIGAYTLWNNSGVYSRTGSASADFSAFLSVDAITNLTNPPITVPEPSTMLLFGVGLFGVFVLRQRKQRKTQGD